MHRVQRGAGGRRGHTKSREHVGEQRAQQPSRASAVLDALTSRVARRTVHPAHTDLRPLCASCCSSCWTHSTLRPCSRSRPRSLLIAALDLARQRHGDRTLPRALQLRPPSLIGAPSQSHSLACPLCAAPPPPLCPWTSSGPLPHLPISLDCFPPSLSLHVPPQPCPASHALALSCLLTCGRRSSSRPQPAITATTANDPPSSTKQAEAE